MSCRFQSEIQKETRRGKKTGVRQRGGHRDEVERKRTSCLLLMGSSSARLVCSLVAKQLQWPKITCRETEIDQRYMDRMASVCVLVCVDTILKGFGRVVFDLCGFIFYFTIFFYLSHFQ